MTPLRSFIDGLIKPSLTSVVVALTLMLSFFALALFGLTPERLVAVIRWHQQYDFLRINDAQFITANGIELLGSGNEGPGVILIGGSTLREAVDVPHLDKTFAANGRELDVQDMSFSAQRIIDSIAVVDFIPEAYKGVVAVGINPVRIGGKFKASELIHDRRIGILGPTLMEEAQHWPVEKPEPTGLYAWDNRRFLLALWKDIVRIVPDIVRGTKKRDRVIRHFYLDLPPRDDESLLHHFDQVEISLSQYDELAPLNLAALSRMNGYLRQRGLKMVLVETPLNPRFVESLGKRLDKDFYARFSAQIQSFAKTQDIPYLRPAASIDVPAGDFYDWAHFRTQSAQYAFTETLEKQLRPYLKEAAP
jgi:hypothetical protein